MLPCPSNPKQAAATQRAELQILFFRGATCPCYRATGQLPDVSPPEILATSRSQFNGRNQAKRSSRSLEHDGILPRLLLQAGHAVTGIVKALGGEQPRYPRAPPL